MSHYLISEASRLVDEESHVLRYWEEELALKIPRNDLGHRYYTEVQLEIFRIIKDLKQEGYQLREIKQYLEEMEEQSGEICTAEVVVDNPETTSVLTPEDRQQAKICEFRELMTDILAEAVGIGFERMSSEISEQVSQRVIKEMNYLDREREEREEERFKELDEAIRNRQRRKKERNEAAATVTPTILQKKRRWGKK